MEERNGAGRGYWPSLLNMATKTPECKALQKLMHAICSNLSSTPDAIAPLATDLCGNEVINEATARSVKATVGLTPYEKASKLVTAVQGTVKLNTEKFHVFVEKLEEHGFSEMSEKLLKAPGK